ncbi:MAG: c-type cytochrome [Chlorobiaceae bacterium]
MSRFLLAALCAFFVLSFSGIDAMAAYDLKAGKSVYDTACIVCHKTGMGGTPKLGDKAAWAPRIAQGMDVLISKSIKGFQGKTGLMPAKGGNLEFTDAQIGNSVAYIVENSK